MKKLILNGKLISARYFANEISKIDGDKTHIWLKFKIKEDIELIAFVYRLDKGKHILYPHSSSLGAEISVSDELYNDIKNLVTQQRNLNGIGIVIGSSALTDSIINKWLSSNENIERETVDIDELSITFEHPSFTEPENKNL